MPPWAGARGLPMLSIDYTDDDGDRHRKEVVENSTRSAKRREDRVAESCSLWGESWRVVRLRISLE